MKIMNYLKTDPLFTISVAAQLTKLHPQTLMLYERYGLIKPFRTQTDRRRYSQADLEKIRFIHYLAQNKKANLSGIKVILEIMDLLGRQKFRIKSKLFSDFKTEA